jgi:DNA invertase Pin-like site-specific DNA recombinase
MPAKLPEAVAYLRTSSATNAGPDKDSEWRQRVAIQAFSKRAGYALVEEFSDPGVSGADPIAERPGFAKLLDRIEGNGVRVVLVEDASRFARELMTQELGIIALVQRGVRHAGRRRPAASVALDETGPEWPERTAGSDHTGAEALTRGA